MVGKWSGGWLGNGRLDFFSAEHLGSTSYLYANTRAGEPVVAQATAARGAVAGDRIAVSIPAAQAFAFDEDGARLR